MGIKVGINGFGRIGRLVFKRIVECFDNIDVIAINDLADNETLVHLLKYDSVHGKFPEKLKLNGDNLEVGKRKVKLLSEKNPENLGWAAWSSPASAF